MGQRVNLTGATRATGRMPTTILGWIRASERARDDERAARDDLFHAGEAIQEAESIRGRGHTWSLDLDAVERVHRARGGVVFYREAALPLARVPLALVDEVATLRARLDALEQENARLRGAGVARVARSARVARREITRESARAPLPSRDAPAPRAPTSDERALEAIAIGMEYAALALDELRRYPLSTFPSLPAGWIPITRWCKDADLNYRSVETLIERGVLPAGVRGAWRVGANNVARMIWSPSQLENVLDCFAYLATHSERALSPTLRATLDARHAQRT